MMRDVSEDKAGDSCAPKPGGTDSTLDRALSWSATVLYCFLEQVTRSVYLVGANLFRVISNSVLLFCFSAAAQPAIPPQADPLINMMLAQPRIDLSAPVKATASFDPPVIGQGESGFYRVTFNTLEEMITMPDKFPVPPAIDLKPSAHGQVLQFAPPVMVPLTVFNFRIQAGGPGRIIIPAFEAKVYGTNVFVPAADLEIISNPTPIAATPARLALDFPFTNLYVGQALPVGVIMPGSPGGSGTASSPIQFIGQGFIVDQGVARQMVQALPRDGINVVTYTYDTLLTPLEAGPLSFFAQGFVNANRFGGPIVINSSGVAGILPQFNLLESEDVELHVRPLPRDGQLQGFTGAIGRFTVEQPTLGTNALRVGDPVKLMVAIRSNGIPSNFARLVPPAPPRPHDWQVLAAGSDGAPASFVQARGYAIFYYTLVPLNEKSEETPAIPFSYFDPVEGRYVDLTIPPVKVTVAPGQIPADVATLMKETPGRSAEKMPVLSGLASAPGRGTASLVPVQQKGWFLMLQLVPAFGLGGLWQWDRRRRYLEQHPEVILKRIARRALRRQRGVLKRALRNQDAKTFAAAAVSAMREASAPHYPAEPNALVGRDVIRLFDEAKGDEHLKPVVQRFFALTDETSFSANAADATPLLNQWAELEQVLSRLEGRL